jgi:hypothetical protein
MKQKGWAILGEENRDFWIFVRSLMITFIRKIERAYGLKPFDK